jgi:integrase/recombinase XerD
MLPEIDKFDNPVEGELLPYSHGGFLDIAFENNGSLNAAVSFIDALNSPRSKGTASTVLNTIARLFGSPGYTDFEWHRLELKHIKFVMKILGSDEEDLLKDVSVSRTYYLRALHIANCRLWKTGYVSTRTDWSTLSPVTERKTWKKKSKNTRKLYISIIKGVSKEAHTMDLMPTSVYLKIKDYKFRSTVDGVQFTTLDGDAARRIVKECVAEGGIRGVRDAVVIGLLYGCGLRRDEVRKLKIQDLNFLSEDDLHISIVGKGEKLRTVFVPEGLVPLLNLWVEEYRGKAPGSLISILYRKGKDDVLASTNDAGELKSPGDNMVYRIVKKRFPESLDVAPHDLRRAFATDLFDENVGGGEVQKLMGHVSFGTTKSYDQRALKRAKIASRKIKI